MIAKYSDKSELEEELPSPQLAMSQIIDSNCKGEESKELAEAAQTMQKLPLYYSEAAEDYIKPLRTEIC